MMKSHITGGPTDLIFCARIMGKYDVSYFQCRETGYIQTEEPHWLAEAYASPINVTDTGILVRNSRFAPTVGALLFSFFGSDARYLDYGGGYGLFARMMRDAGFDFLWQDRYSANLFARGFEFDPDSDRVACLTAFEVFEHLPNPRAELEAMRRISPNLVFSTVLVSNPAPPVDDWWYYALEHGQHVSFYTESALRRLAEEGGAQLATNGSDLHMFLDPDVVPQNIVASWLHDWMIEQRPSVRDLIGKSYRFVPQPLPDGGLRQRLRNILLKRQFRGFFSLRRDLKAADISAVAATGLSQAYAIHLLQGGAEYWHWLSAHLHPRAMDDMLMLRGRIQGHIRPGHSAGS